MGNKIGKEQLAKLQETMHSKPNLVSLCGIADNATGADLSGLKMDADGAAILASGLLDKGAMTKFDISSNEIRAEGGKALAEGLKGNNQVITELNFSGNNLGYNSNGRIDTSGIVAIADIIPGMGGLSMLIFGGEQYFDGQKLAFPEPATLQLDMTEEDLSKKNLGVGGAIIISAWLTHRDRGAMTSLNLASNGLGAEGATIVAAAIKATKCTPVIILAPFSCPSDFSINCCCLLLSAGYGGTTVSESCKQHDWLVILS
jgi:hypothetical protein